MSVPQIIDKILDKHNFISESYAFKLRETYKEREYCVEYGESDLHFLCRLAEEEGIYWYHEHAENGHCLCFSDAEGGPRIPGESLLRFYPGSGQPEDTAVISRLNLRQRVNSDSATFREWNFTTPGIDLSGRQKEEDMAKAPVPLAMSLETYQFPHLYQTRDEGERYVKLQLQRQLTFCKWLEGESDVCRFLPGFTFSVYEHPRADVNRAWWISEVRHEGQQPGVLRHEAPSDRGLEYKSVVTAIPDDTRFVPEINHKKVRIDGLQSAIVTGPSGEEVYTDEYGRVKVQFHWDRLGANDERTTCWVRVADSWAGTNFGFIQVPRIGQEVMVEFMEGDPDRPVITGRVYNPDNMPPWQLPEQKTLSGIQSREFKAGRRNQLVLDDSNGQIQAQLSSDHDLSQLNLGYITRVNHVEGRKDFRGEGFELRSDSWGGIRAGKGLVISTDARSSAERHQKDIAEAMSNLDQAASQHQDQAGLAVKHEAQDFGEHQKPVGNALSKQNSDLRGSGQPHGELTAPHILISSPAGIATTTPNSTHIHSGDHTAVTAGSHISLASNKSFIATAVERVSLFAHSLGMKLFAAKGKVEIQAQSDDLDIIAEKVASFISAQKTIRLSAPKEILLTADGSYIKINGQGIEKGTNGAFKVHSSTTVRGLTGPNTMPNLTPAFAISEPDPLARLVMTDQLHRGLQPDRDAVNGTGTIDAAASSHALHLFGESQKTNIETLQQQSGGYKYNVIVGNAIDLGEAEQDDGEEA